jgi:uncharacterized protein (DUF1499 family)
MNYLLWILLAAPALLMMGALLLNRPPLFDEPGLLPRLKTYLTQNVAQTAPDHFYPELRTPVFTMGENQFPEAVAACMHSLGWRNVREEGGVVKGEVVTMLLRFTDDVEVRWQATTEGLAVHLRAASRVGKADFAANQRHLSRLLSCLRASAG